MFCNNCGKKISESAKFCTECGKLTFLEEVEVKILQNSNLEQKWWFRLVKVVYISLYIILPFILITVWAENSRYPEEAFWFTLITFLIYMTSARLIKITFFYIVFAQKPRWKKEFKKFF